MAPYSPNTRPQPRRSRSALTLLTALAGALCLVLAIAPSADATPTPAEPAGMRVVSVTASSVTVTARPSPRARSYRLFLSTYRPDLYWANLAAGRASSARRSASSRRPTITISRLSYTPKLLYYRMEAINGSKYMFSKTIGITGLRPSTPTGVRVVSSSRGFYLTWSGSAAGYTIAQGTNRTLTAHRIGYVDHDGSHQFTPYALARGGIYYFRVRAWNYHTGSGYSALVSARVDTRGQWVRLMTYNILQLTADGQRESGNVIAPWLKRRAGEVALIRHVNPDVIAVQEGWPTAGRTPRYRQVDSLRDGLAAVGENYTVANTEARYPNHGWVRTGQYVLYKPSKYRAVGAGGHWALGYNWFAAWQELQNRSSGAAFLCVAVHLLPQSGRTADLDRERETQNLVRDANAKAASLHVPVVYAGDFNSNAWPKWHPIDGPGLAMRAAHVADARLVAQHHIHASWDTINRYSRRPGYSAFDIDYVYASPGIAAAWWSVALHLRHAAFVGTIPSDHNPVYVSLKIPY